MPTVLNKNFRYVEFTDGNYKDGVYVHGTLIADRSVRGTIQSATYEEQIPAITGTRMTGNVDVFSSERLKSRTRGENDGGYVFYDEHWYQLVSEQSYTHIRRISHYKYVAEMVPQDELPTELKELS